MVSRGSGRRHQPSGGDGAGYLRKRRYAQRALHPAQASGCARVFLLHRYPQSQGPTNGAKSARRDGFLLAAEGTPGEDRWLGRADDGAGSGRVLGYPADSQQDFGQRLAPERSAEKPPRADRAGRQAATGIEGQSASATELLARTAGGAESDRILGASSLPIASPRIVPAPRRPMAQDTAAALRTASKGNRPASKRR